MNAPAVDPCELRATADELDALAFGLTGSSFPDAGPTLVAAATEEQRPMVAARLVASLAVRGIVVDGPQGPTVAAAFQPLLACRLAADITVLVRVRTPRSSSMAAVCRRDGDVVVHTAGSPEERSEAPRAGQASTAGHGVHVLRRDSRALADAVLAQLAVPEDVAYRADANFRPVWTRYRDLLQALEGPEASPFLAALRDYRYAAKLTCVTAGPPHAVSTTAVIAGAKGPLWIASVEPDGDGEDGWVCARAVAGVGLTGAVTNLLTGSPSHSGPRPPRSRLAV